MAGTGGVPLRVGPVISQEYHSVLQWLHGANLPGQGSRGQVNGGKSGMH